MITLESTLLVDGITGAEITCFLLNPTDDRYRAWRPSTHLQFHLLAATPGHVGDLVRMDEYVGSHRLRMEAVVVEAVPGQRIAWQLKRWVRLPAWLRIEVTDQDDGCLVRHIVEIGYRGAGRLLDPLLRLCVSQRFSDELDEHVSTEFQKLRDVLRSAQSPRPLGGDLRPWRPRVFGKTLMR